MNLPHIGWFPKPFGPGDMAGQGAQRLLGQPNMDIGELLVRETAQNSWDARLDGHVPEYELHLRHATQSQVGCLRQLFAGGSGPDLGISDVLDRDDVRVAEVHDRGTHGLGGPVRNDVVAAPGERTDFSDFVLTLGAPRDNDFGGGTYGFGKTAAYSASSCATVVIWSRTLRAGSLQHRFIASAFGPTFEDSTRRFTGRQWWGKLVGGSVEPLVDDEAQAWGESVFSRRFEGSETGTSLLILAPGVSEGEDALVEIWRRAIVRNLWPKLIRGQAADRTMRIAILHDGVPIPLVGHNDRLLFEAHGKALEAVRAVQTGKHFENGPEVEVHPIERRSPRRVLGHLAFCRFVPEFADDPATEPERERRAPENKVALMRTEAELVVKHLPGGPGQVPSMRWVGVFKPVRDLQEAFARAEPPAHDDWNPAGLQHDQRLDVKLALDRIRSTTDKYLEPVTATRTGDASVSAGAVSVALAGLAGAAAGGRATTRVVRGTAGQSAPRRGGAPTVAVERIEHLAPDERQHAEGRQCIQVGLIARGDGERLVVRAIRLAVAVEGSSLVEPGLVTLMWLTRDGARLEDAERTVRPGELIKALIEFPAGLAVDFAFGAEVAS